MAVLSFIAEKMGENAKSAIKDAQCFLISLDVKARLLGLFQEEADFVVEDPTGV